MRRLTLILVSVTIVAASANAVAGPSEFARGRVLDVGDGGPVARVMVPDDVYEWVTRADLGDLRVFDGGGEEVPYGVRRPPRSDEYSLWQALPLFRLPPPDADVPGSPRLQIERDDAGTIIAVLGGAVSPASPGEGTTDRIAYLLDASLLESPPTELRLDWSSEGDLVARVRIDSSADLDTWQPLVDTATLASLVSAEGSVRLDGIELPRRAASYLRITQIEGAQPLELVRVEARHRRSEVPARRWKTLPGVAVEGGFEFEADGYYPIDRITLTRSDLVSSYLVTARVQSRSDPEEPWRDLGTRTFYRTEVGGRVAESEAFGVGRRDHYWRIEPDGALLDEPLLKIGWLPDEVVFLTQGAGPYVLAYGSAGARAREWPLRRLLAQLDGSSDGASVHDASLGDVPFARAAGPETLGGPDRLVAPAEPVDWQTVVLWLVLVLGVLLVAGIAYRLLKTGATDQEQSRPDD